MSELTYSQWKRQGEKEGWNGFYLFYGEELYLIGTGAKKITDEVSAGALREFNLHQFDGDADLDDVEDATLTLPVMAEKKCVTLCNYAFDQRPARDTERLLKMIEKLPESTVMVLYYTMELYNKKSDKWKSFLRKVGKLGTCVICDKRDKGELEKLLSSYAKKLDCEISRKNLLLLFEMCGDDLQLLLHEMEKLCAYTGQGEITAETVRLVASQNMETTVFVMVRNLVAGNSDGAFAMLDLLFKQNEKAPLILSVLSGSYVDMYRVKAAVLSGYDEKYPAQIFPYKGREFLLTAAQRNSKGFSIETLRKSLCLLADTEIQLKTSPGERHRMILECLFVNLMKLRAGEKT